MERPKENQELLLSEGRKIEIHTQTEDGTTKITDLNDDCLERIFGYLNLKDLVNIGLSNTRFKFADGIVFKRTYPHQFEFKLTSKFGLLGTYRGKLLNPTQSQSVIQVFGDFISSIKLEVEIKIAPKQLEKFKKLIVKVSFKSLLKFEFEHFPRSCLNFHKPLPKVEYVSLVNCDLSDGTVLLSEIFPKLNHLKIDCEDTRHIPARSLDDTKYSQIITHFPHLKNLELTNLSRVNSRFCSEFESFLKLNRQLSFCTYHSEGFIKNWKLIKFMAAKLHLEKLELVFLTPIGDIQIHFPHLKHFVYECYNHNDNKIRKFPFTFDKLEKLKLLNFGSCAEKYKTNG